MVCTKPMNWHEELRAAIQARTTTAKKVRPRRWRQYNGNGGLQGVHDIFAVHHRDMRSFDPGEEGLAFMVGNDPARILRDCIEDLDVFTRHERDEKVPGNCFWCSEDGFTPINVPWPCPEIRSLARRYAITIESPSLD